MPTKLGSWYLLHDLGQGDVSIEHETPDLVQGRSGEM